MPAPALQVLCFQVVHPSIHASLHSVLQTAWGTSPHYSFGTLGEKDELIRISGQKF